MRRVAIALGGGLALVVLGGLAGLLWTHAEMRRLDPPLPGFDALAPPFDVETLPVRLRYWNTASQAMPRAQVLAAALDPEPGVPYRMSHPAFGLEWADGRVLLIDAGMEREAAAAFGRPIEWLGGEPIVPHGSLAERVGPGLARRPLAVLFTHLHTDHTGGIAAVCTARDGAPIRLFQTAAQAERANYTTRAGHADLEAASCLEPERLDPAPAAAVPGHPGVVVIHAAGHTPGSQIVAAWLRDGESVRGFLFTGDVVNHAAGVLHDVPKPWAYRHLVVPESDARQARLRRFLREAVERTGMELVVSHDQRQLEALGLPVWAAGQ
ncbi:MAG: MBL fold metallo-hydrolase [Myxococcota bacterium]|nr:MBL fold metallo-hydrolase [Myxococcota bacterium]